MTKLQFNIAVAERVMGWLTPTSSKFAANGYEYIADGYWHDGPDFATDHNAAAMVRERVAKFLPGTQANFVMNLLVSVQQDMNLPEEITWYHLWQVLQATPEQTARAAYLAVTGEELEAVDE